MTAAEEAPEVPRLVWFAVSDLLHLQVWRALEILSQALLCFAGRHASAARTHTRAIITLSLHAFRTSTASGCARFACFSSLYAAIVLLARVGPSKGSNPTRAHGCV
jgi:hypothetical protein